MHQINEIVVHKIHGICKILDRVSFSYAEGEFFKISPLSDLNLVIYVPCDNKNNLIRSIMSVNEADELLKYIKTIDDSLCQDTKNRRDEYAKLLNTGDIKDIAFLTKKLNILINDKIKKNKSIGVIDQDTFKKAKNLLVQELSLAYHKNSDEVEEILLNELN